MGDRLKNENWSVNRGASGMYSTENAILTVLMDLRDELQTLVRVINCRNCLNIPKTLRSIERQLKLQRRCPVHPRYTGAKSPSVDCRACRRFYKAVWK